MHEMIRYIFSSLEATERTIRNQAKFNRSIAMFAVIASAYAVLQTKKIQNLEKEIIELKKKEEIE